MRMQGTEMGLYGEVGGMRAESMKAEMEIVNAMRKIINYAAKHERES